MSWLSYEARDWLRQQRTGIVIIAVATVFATAAIYYSFYIAGGQGVYVDKHLCLLDGSIPGHHVVLLDGTDQFDLTQQEIVQRVIHNEAAMVRPFEKLTIAAVDQDRPYSPHVLFSGCAPKNSGDANRWSENPDIIGSIWNNRFMKPALVPLRVMAAAPGQRRTPLVESVFGMTLWPDFSSSVRHRHLVIVSDMLQNTSLYSHYGGKRGPSFADFAGRPGALQNIPDLTGVTVVGYYLIRTATMSLQSDAQKQFWIDYFGAAQTSVRFEGWPWHALQSLRGAAAHQAPPLPVHRHHHRRRPLLKFP